MRIIREGWGGLQEEKSGGAAGGRRSARPRLAGSGRTQRRVPRPTGDAARRGGACGRRGDMAEGPATSLRTCAE